MVIPVHHKHVTVAGDTQIRNAQCLSIAARSINLSDKRVAIGEPVRPVRQLVWVGCVKMITIHDQDRHGRQHRELLVRVRSDTAILEIHRAFQSLLD